MSVERLLRWLGVGPAPAGAEGGASDRRALAALRDEMTALARATERLQDDFDLLSRQMAQSRALAAAEADAPRAMAALGASLDLAAVTHHARAAIASAISGEAPVRHVAVEGLLPTATLAAAQQAIPSVPFPSAAGGDGLTLPPRVAPADVVATWMFLNDVATDLLGPALRLRLGTGVPESDEPAGLKLRRSRLVQVPAGMSPLDERHVDDWMTLVVSLGPEQANAALAFRGGARVHESLRASLALPAKECWQAWELTFAPAAPRRGTRRRHGDLDSWAP